ncbi:MAG TPA: hypothetical protein DCO80_06885 [Ornithinibacillus sp.]|nr:hypothetical protein [Ornithinibacillus sp.]
MNYKKIYYTMFSILLFFILCIIFFSIFVKNELLRDFSIAGLLYPSICLFYYYKKQKNAP